MRLVFLAVAFVALAFGHRTADACQRSEPDSPLGHLYGASSVIFGEVQTSTKTGYLVRRLDTISGSHTADVTLPFSDCDTLTVGAHLVLAIGQPDSMWYPIVAWPAEPENQALLVAFAKAKTDAEIAVVLAKHVRKGWSSYVDFPMIALFLERTPAVVKEIPRNTAREMLRDLSRHPRAKVNAEKALAARRRP